MCGLACVSAKYFVHVRTSAFSSENRAGAHCVGRWLVVIRDPRQWKQAVKPGAYLLVTVVNI